MKFNANASHLVEEEWNSTSCYLDSLEVKLLSIAKNFKLKIRRGQSWPYIEMYHQSFRTISSYKFILNSNYMEDNEVYFDLILQEFTKHWVLKKKLKSSRKLASYTTDHLQNTEDVISDINKKIRKSNKISVGVN